MESSTVISISVLVIGIVLTFAAILTNYIIKARQVSNGLALSNSSNLWVFLKKYFWIIIVAFGIMCTIYGIVQLA